ncbi:hypothetical protein ZWY2020_025737 [Hordeum vulgare]|nr:hypothetical protein ZWY2020_025737 [Hordeum vulgare]
MLLRETCHVDRLEWQSKRLHNAAVIYVWVWTWNPDDFPKSMDPTVLERSGDGRMHHQLPEDATMEEGHRGPEGRALIHLLLTKDYTSSSPDLPPPAECPDIYRYDADVGCMDGLPAVPARSSCGSTRHVRHRDDCADDEGHNR